MRPFRRRRRRQTVPAFHFVPAHLLGGQPHVIVDGAVRRGTVYTLSHWPGTPTPAAFEADLSAEIVHRALGHPARLPESVAVASIDHLDVDGLVALGLLVLEGLDADHGPLLVEAARVGDFGVVTDRRAAVIAFALDALDDEAGDEALGASTAAGVGDHLAGVGLRAQAALDLLPELVSRPESFESLWGDRLSAYDASVRALAEGWATIEDVAHLDLAVVRVESGHEGARAATWMGGPLHPAAVHSATPRLRVVTLADQVREFHFRYESWVRLASHRPRPRVDLARLALELSALEKTASRWVFDGAGSTTGSLHVADDDAPSTIEPERFLDLLCERLATLDEGPPAWDPYRV